MFVLMMASMMAVAGDPVPFSEAARHTGPDLQCREVGTAASRSQAILVCRTKAQWLRAESCRNVTRYCAPTKSDASLGRPSAFAMNEDSRVVCRVLKATGTRLTSQRTCLPQREWQRMWDESAGTMSSLQNRHSTPAEQFGPR
ncbi:MAG: hypothetical protein V4696_11090 [Pseudomonadota bacterium]